MSKPSDSVTLTLSDSDLCDYVADALARNLFDMVEYKKTVELTVDHLVYDKDTDEWTVVLCFTEEDKK